MLSRNDWTVSLLNALQQSKLQLADLSLDQKQNLAGHPSKKVAARAKKLLASSGGGLPNPDRQKVVDLWRKYTNQDPGHWQPANGWDYPAMIRETLLHEYKRV